MNEDPVAVLLRRFTKNLERMVLLHSEMKKVAPAGDVEGIWADVARAVVVFVYATFEDALRSVARQKLQTDPSPVLGKLPLVGTAILGRSEKFTFADLWPHQDKTVSKLVAESLHEYLDTKSFSSVTDVAILMKQISVDPSKFADVFADIGAMMARRHQIVHNADFATWNHVDVERWSAADSADLNVWITATGTVILQLIVEAFGNDITNLSELQGAADYHRRAWSWQRRSRAKLDGPASPPVTPPA